MERRDFVAAVAAGVARWDPGASPRGQPHRRQTADRPMVGIQVGAVSFVDEGTDKVLDGFQALAGINTLFLATFTYGRGIAGRQLRGQPLPDHGKQEYDDACRGRNSATPHRPYCRATSIGPKKAPDHPGYDVIADVLPAARRRGMRLYCWFEDVFRRDVPGFDGAAEIDLHGASTGLACHRNPTTRNFWLGLAEDYLRSYDVDGLMWGSERQGPLDNALAASHGGGGNGIGCFCPHCLDAARKWSIDVDRAREGYLALRIWPGIDIDIPTGANDKKTQPEDVYQAVRAAFQGGAHGVLLSRKYSEMKLANLRAAGRAVRELAPA